MEAIVKTKEGAEPSQTLVGVTVCRGPGRFRMILTRPYHDAGRVVEIPRQDIESIEEVAPTTLGEGPAPTA